MQCVNCGRLFPTTPDQHQRLWAAAEVLSKLMEELGMPQYGGFGTPLYYLNGNLACCRNPKIRWDTEE